MIYTKWFAMLGILFPILGFAASAPEEADPITFVLINVTGIFFFAILGRYLARRLKQPSVLGELLIGVVLGNIFYHYGYPLLALLREGSATFEVVKEMLHGMTAEQAVAQVIPRAQDAQQVLVALQSPHGADYLKIAYVVDIFSRYGVIFLLFMVGMESSLEDLKRSGKDSTRVAILGVLAPMGLGFLTAYLLMPEASYQADLFIAATLSATSIGITARVLAEMKKLQTGEARTILGAAMLDDVLGLIILAVVSSIVINGAVDFTVVLRIIVSSVMFFVTALLLGPILLRHAVTFFRFLEPWEAKLFISFLFIMFLSWLASFMQLATIIGAFTAGIILHEEDF